MLGIREIFEAIAWDLALHIARLRDSYTVKPSVLVSTRGLRRTFLDRASADSTPAEHSENPPPATNTGRIRATAGVPTTNEPVEFADVFKPTGVPTLTFVEPADFVDFRLALRQPGLGIIVEGPSGTQRNRCHR